MEPPVPIKRTPVKLEVTEEDKIAFTDTHEVEEVLGVELVGALQEEGYKHWHNVCLLFYVGESQWEQNYIYMLRKKRGSWYRAERKILEFKRKKIKDWLENLVPAAFDSLKDCVSRKEPWAILEVLNRQFGKVPDKTTFDATHVLDTGENLTKLTLAQAEVEKGKIIAQLVKMGHTLPPTTKLIGEKNG